MPTERQLSERRKHLGSSDLAAICNVHPFKTAGDVVAEKCFDMIQDDSDVLRNGRYMELAIREYATDQLGALTANQERRVRGHPIKVHIDFVVNSDGLPVEAKSVGATSFFSPLAKAFGDEGSDEVPDMVSIQAHGHMLGLTADVDGLKGYPEKCHIPAFIIGRGFQMFRVPFNRELAKFILDQADMFWEAYVEPGIYPDPSEFGPVRLHTLKRIRRVPEKTIDVPDSVAGMWTAAWDALEEQKRLAREASKEAEARQAGLIENLGDAEAARLPDGRMITYMQSIRTTVDSKALKIEDRATWERFKRETPYRTLRIKKSPYALPGGTDVNSRQ